MVATILLIWILISVSVLLGFQVKAWAESRANAGSKPEPIERALTRLDKAERLALSIPDVEEREAYLAGIAAQRRRLLFAQATGASIDTRGSKCQNTFSL